jgi:hypothetical protein
VERVVDSRVVPDPADWCINRLGEADDYFLSAHELWKEFTGAGGTPLGYEDFERVLRSDERLYVTRGPVSEVPASQQEVLRQMGFPVRALVALADRKPRQEALDNAIYARAIQLQQALLKLWNARPPAELEMENKLKRLLEETRKLCEALKPFPDKSDRSKT